MAWLTKDSDYYGVAQDLMYDLAKWEARAEPLSLREVGNELRLEFIGEFQGITSSALASLYEEYLKWYHEFNESEGSECD